MAGRFKNFSMLGTLVAALILGWVVFDGISRLSGQNQTQASFQTNEPSASSGRASYDFNRIVQAHLFGKKEVEAAQPTHLPETKLRLDLLGMISSADSHYARAMIAVNSRNVKVYRVGDSIEGTDASLHAVEKTRILLDRNGVVESLRIKRPDIFSDGSSGPDQATQPSRLGDAAYTVEPEPESETGEGANEIRYSGVKEPGGQGSKFPF